jgi:exonuclease SbcD
MRLIHTADWHLGRLFHGVHLTDDQAHLLDQMVLLVKDAKADAVLVAGDVYDRAVPPPEAVELLGDVLARLVLDLGVKVILIAGNHDSPQRLGFGARILSPTGLHLFGQANGQDEPVILPDAYGPVAFLPLPFAEPALVRQWRNNAEIQDHQTAMAARIQGMAADVPRRVAVAHAFLAGGLNSESERPLSVGGTDAVSADLFQSFSYAALGHLHRPQSVGTDRVQYSGGLMKYSFSEAGDVKSVNVVDLDEAGNARVERIPLTPRRDVRRVRGFFQDLLAKPPEEGSREDYLEIELLDQGALLEPLARLRDVYPGLLSLTRVFLASEGPVRPAVDHRRRAEADLFADFFRQVTGQDLNPGEREVFEQALADWERTRREADR